MRCPSCQASNPRRAKFCLECGEPLAPDAAPASGTRGLAGTRAERRQLTCLFCDLEHSAALAERLDPEDWRAVLADYQRVCTQVIQRFDGHIAQYFGDGILVYFGFPHAHEDEAQRAARTGLGIVEAVGQLNARLERERGIRLHVRIGIHTGLVVVGDIAPGERLESMAAIGEAPIIAARVQALAAQDSVVLTGATYGLIAGYFNCRELGFKPISGTSHTLPIYELLHESAARTRLDVAAARGLTSMVGRDAELAALIERWRQALAGQGQAVVIAGESGIGKSRLTRALHEHVAQSPDASLIQLGCSPYYQHTAFQPIVEFLASVALLFEPDASVAQRLDKIEGLLTQYGLSLNDGVPLLAKLLSVPFEDRYPPLDLPADRQKQLTIDTLVQIVLMRATKQPLLVVVEDLHWADASTLEILGQLMQRAPGQRLLMVFTARPEFKPPWPDVPGLTGLPLNRLDRSASEAIVIEVAGQRPPAAVLGQLLDKADGVPLYLEELAKLVVELGLVDQGAGQRAVAGGRPEVAIPATLADSLMARLDRLASAKSLAQLGATIGRQFSYALLVAVLRSMGPVDESAVRRDLARLVDAGLVFADRVGRGARYTFKHALIRDAAYEALLRSVRQQHHQRIAEVLRDQFPDTVEAAPELLAHHYTQAGLIPEAVPYWLRAGQRAVRSSAHPEAIAHLTTGLALLQSQPPSPQRAAHELELHLTLGPVYMATRGYGAAEVEAEYDRARALCRELGDTPQLAPVLYGLWTYRVVRAQHASALELGRQVLEIGQANQDEALLIQGHLASGWSRFFLGQPAAAREHFERLFELYDPEKHSGHVYRFGDNPAISAGTCLAETLWLLGYADQAIARREATLAALRSVTHPYTVAFGLSITSFMGVYLNDPATARAVAEESIALARERGLPLIAAMSSVVRGWALARQGDVDEGLAEMLHGVASHLATGAALLVPFWYWLLAAARARAGDPRQGLADLAEAERAVEATDERYWEAEVHRLRGELLLGQPDVGSQPAAAESYTRALEVARRQGARALELRAAVSLARLRLGQGRAAQARKTLLGVYQSFTEGFDTPDLREAAALLIELGVPAAELRHPILLGGAEN